ncbi:MAG: YdcF family protein [Acidobacteria bacterium]|nr:YdcF family protein [Acidobacteriota bacterium]
MIIRRFVNFFANKQTWVQLVEKIIFHKWKIIIILPIMITLIIVLINFWVFYSVNNRVFLSIDKVPENNVALVLGTSRYVAGGRVNLHFKARMEAAAQLYKKGKVKHLLVSGDNSVKEYDEPSDMKEVLMQLEIPENAITLDYAGFRTLDSVVRAKEVFGQDKLTIVTDEFHSHRAVFLAKYSGIEAVGFCSKKVPFRYSPNTYIREYFARVKALVDLFIGKQPKFLGSKVEIKIEN